MSEGRQKKLAGAGLHHMQNSCTNSTEHGPGAGDIAEQWLLTVTQQERRMLRKNPSIRKNNRQQRNLNRGEFLTDCLLRWGLQCVREWTRMTWCAILHLSYIEGVVTPWSAEWNASSCPQSIIRSLLCERWSKSTAIQSTYWTLGLLQEERWKKSDLKT